MKQIFLLLLGLPLMMVAQTQESHLANLKQLTFGGR